MSVVICRSVPGVCMGECGVICVGCVCVYRYNCMHVCLCMLMCVYGGGARVYVLGSSHTSYSKPISDLKMYSHIRCPSRS